MRKILLAAFALMSFSPALAAPAPMAFVSCPIVRDTKSVPCWLAEFKGELYYLGIQVDQAAAFDPPSLGHRALVEGTPSDKRICGGLVMEPVHVSVLPERDESCNTMLPADDRYQLPFAAPRAPGPRAKRQTAEDAAIGTRAAPPAAPQPPFAAKEFVVTYDFDNERAGLSTRVMQQAMTYANAIKAKKVTISAYRASVLLSDGSRIVEQDFIAERRAKTLADTMIQIGVPAEIVDVKWNAKAEVATGAADASKRRATILVTP